MDLKPALLLLGLLVGCGASDEPTAGDQPTTGNDPTANEPNAETAAARPEVRYYVIADV